MRGGEVVTHQVHNLKIVGAIPTPATKFMNCWNCDKELNSRRKNPKFCNNNKCFHEYHYNQKVQLWLDGKHDGMRGSTGTAKFIKQYLIEVRGESCEKCGWCERHPLTNKVPIELNHIDGNFRNNKIENLELICPNCHSLTKTYRALNYGQGRPRNKDMKVVNNIQQSQSSSSSFDEGGLV